MQSQTVQKKRSIDPTSAGFSGDFPPRETRSLCLALLPERSSELVGGNGSASSPKGCQRAP